MNWNSISVTKELALLGIVDWEFKEYKMYWEHLLALTPGRNNQQWNANQDGRKWTPTSASNTSNYTTGQIPYVNVAAPGGGNEWKSTTGQTYPYNNGVLNVSLLPPGTSRFYLVGTSCGVSVGSISDTTFITRTSASVTATSNPAVCGSNSGELIANPTSGTAPFTYNWTPGNLSGQNISNVAPGTYAVFLTDSNGCKSNALTTITNVAPVFDGDSTLVSCPGGSDGTATATLSPTGATTTYLWDDLGTNNANRCRFNSWDIQLFDYK